MHHSSVDINYPMGAALDEAVAWAAVNGTSPDDLVVFHSWDCAGDGCEASARAAVEERAHAAVLLRFGPGVKEAAVEVRGRSVVRHDHVVLVERRRREARTRERECDGAE